MPWLPYYEDIYGKRNPAETDRTHVDVCETETDSDAGSASSGGIFKSTKKSTKTQELVKGINEALSNKNTVDRRGHLQAPVLTSVGASGSLQSTSSASQLAPSTPKQDSHPAIVSTPTNSTAQSRYSTTQEFNKRHSVKTSAARKRRLGHNKLGIFSPSAHKAQNFDHDSAIRSRVADDHFSVEPDIELYAMSIPEIDELGTMPVDAAIATGEELLETIDVEENESDEKEAPTQPPKRGRPKKVKAISAVTNLAAETTRTTRESARHAANGSNEQSAGMASRGPPRQNKQQNISGRRQETARSITTATKATKKKGPSFKEVGQTHMGQRRSQRGQRGFVNWKGDRLTLGSNQGYVELKV